MTFGRLFSVTLKVIVMLLPTGSVNPEPPLSTVTVSPAASSRATNPSRRIDDTASTTRAIPDRRPAVTDGRRYDVTLAERSDAAPVPAAVTVRVPACTAATGSGRTPDA